MKQPHRIGRRGFTAVLAVLLAASALTSCFRIQKIDAGPKPDLPETGTPETEIPEIDTPETKAPGPDDPGPETAPESAGFTLGELRQRNLMSSLLQSHETVTTRQQYNGEYDTVSSFWMRDGCLAYDSQSEYTYEGAAGKYESGQYRRFSFSVPENGRTAASLWFQTSEDAAMDHMEDTIVSHLPSELTEDIAVLDSDEETLTVLIKGPISDSAFSTVPSEVEAVIRRETLEILSFRQTSTSPDWPYVITEEVEYDGERIGESTFSAWDGKTRDVVFDIRIGEEERTEVEKSPADWELTVLAYPGTGLLVSVPGAEDLGDYTFRVPGGDAPVTVYVRDSVEALEAAVPASVDFTLEDLRTQNGLTSLLNRHQTVSVKGTYPWSLVYTQTFWMRDGERAEYWLSESTMHGDPDVTSGTTYRGFPFQAGAEHAISAMPPVGETMLQTQDEYYNEVCVTEYLPTELTEEIEIVESNGEIFTAILRGLVDVGEMQGIPGVLRAVIRRGTLDILSYVLTCSTNGEEDTFIREITFDGERPCESELSVWDKTREITLDIRSDDGNHSKTFICPTAWEIRVEPVSFDEYGFGTWDSSMLITAPGLSQDEDGSLGIPAGEDPVTLTVSFPADLAAETEPAPLADYAGRWICGPSVLEIREDGSFSYDAGGDLWTGTLRWTTEEKGLWAAGGRYELVLGDGSVLYGDAFVSLGENGLTLSAVGGAELFAKGSMIRAEFPGDTLPEHSEFTADRGDYSVKVLLTAKQPVKNFTFYSLKPETAEDGSIVFGATELYKLADMKPEKPLLVTMTFGEAFPSYGFSYQDESGTYRSYGLTLSGEDGSVVLAEIRVGVG